MELKRFTNVTGNESDAINQNCGLNLSNLIPSMSMFKINISKQANILIIWWEMNISINTRKCFTMGKLYLIHYFFLFSCQYLFRCDCSLNILTPVNLNQNLDVNKTWILLRKHLTEFISNTCTNLFSASFSFLSVGFFLSVFSLSINYLIISAAKSIKQLFLGYSMSEEALYALRIK